MSRPYHSTPCPLCSVHFAHTTVSQILEALDRHLRDVHQTHLLALVLPVRRELRDKDGPRPESVPAAGREEEGEA